MATVKKFSKLSQVNQEEAYEWLMGHSPGHLDGVQEAVRQGATPEQDATEATDMVVRIGDRGAIAVRVRRPGCDWRDLTIRCTTKTRQYPSEIEKIRNGFGDWYVYGWTEDNRLIDWILVDLDIFRDSGLAFTKKPAIPNKDPNDNEFYAYAILELEHYGCLVARYKEKPNTNGVAYNIYNEANQLAIDALRNDEFHSPYYRD